MPGAIANPSYRGIARRLLTPQVREASQALVNALGQACRENDIARDEARARLCLFINLLYDDIEELTAQLPARQWDGEMRRSISR